MNDVPPVGRVWNLARGALGTKALAVVTDLGVPDALAGGPRPVADVAREVGANADSLHRFLRALASDGVFDEVEPGVFRNNDASELLRSDGSWRDFAHLFGGSWYQAVGDAEAMTGEATWPRTFGTDFWSWLAEHSDERASFDRAMAEGWERRLDRIAGLPWREGETVVDVGGGSGSLLLRLVERHPGLRAIVFDLPETVRDEAALARAGCTFVTGSFFERVPAGDVYILGTILHDWEDEPAAAILRTIRDNAAASARVLIIDAVIPAGNEPHGAKWLDLLMLVIGGRERAADEWRALIEGAGLQVDALDDGLIQASCP
ncbi:MAG TPA: methyltransferase [Gaiellaceae bacterium]|nr:methyltransferase [Gaiellaceae bacterium]